MWRALQRRLLRRSAKSRSQGLDGQWHWLKANVYGVNATKESAVDSRIHEAQWWHWTGSDDRWLASGRVLAFVP